MMNFLVVIPMPINYGGGGGSSSSMLKAWWLFLLVWFVVIIIPCIAHSLWLYIKNKRKYKDYTFYWHNLPIITASMFGAYILIFATISLLQLTFWLYDFIY